MPGRIAAIRFAEGSDARTSLRCDAIPARPGDLLNLRDIEQGLENLKRVPTAEADIQIEPSTAPARARATATWSSSTRKPAAARHAEPGRQRHQGHRQHQAGATVSGDNPFGLNDLFYVNANHDAFNHSGQGTERPDGALLGALRLLAAGLDRLAQPLPPDRAGRRTDLRLRRRNAQCRVKLSRLVYRDQRRKTTLACAASGAASRNFIDDTEIEVQRRVVGGWELGLNHREFIGDATLDATLAYKRGTGAFGALPRAGRSVRRRHLALAVSSRPNSALNAPFTLGEQKLRYAGLWRAQWNRTPLTPQDRFAIGGRYTVRGFDGETSLLGDRGWLIRNDIGWALGESGAELYVGIDYGQVGGPSTEQLLGRHLAGGVIGLRGV